MRKIPYEDRYVNRSIAVRSNENLRESSEHVPVTSDPRRRNWWSEIHLHHVSSTHVGGIAQVNTDHHLDGFTHRGNIRHLLINRDRRIDDPHVQIIQTIAEWEGWRCWVQ